jgi:hypothetical protein
VEKVKAIVLTRRSYGRNPGTRALLSRRVWCTEGRALATGPANRERKGVGSMSRELIA